MDGALYAAGTMPEETDEAGSWGFSASSSADGEGEVYSNLSRGRPALFRLDLETGAAEEVAGYAPVPAAEDGRPPLAAAGQRRRGAGEHGCGCPDRPSGGD